MGGSAIYQSSTILHSNFGQNVAVVWPAATEDQAVYAAGVRVIRLRASGDGECGAFGIATKRHTNEPPSGTVAPTESK